VKTYPLRQPPVFWHSAVILFLRSTNRKKDGQDHRYFTVVENQRIPVGKSVQRTVLYLGEVNDQQQVGMGVPRPGWPGASWDSQKVLVLTILPKGLREGNQELPTFQGSIMEILVEFVPDEGPSHYGRNQCRF
jgi:hypothetical protein